MVSGFNKPNSGPPLNRSAAKYLAVLPSQALGLFAKRRSFRYPPVPTNAGAANGYLGCLLGPEPVGPLGAS